MTVPVNANSAHHPTRLVIQFLPDGIPAENRMEPTAIVNAVNNALATKQESNHLKVVAATYNHQRNLILSTRADQTAAQLLPFAEIFTPQIAQGHTVVAREDKRWYKIQVDGLSTIAVTIDGRRTVHTPDAIHKELAVCNPSYTEATDSIVAPPRWMRTAEETSRNIRSSVVFAVDSHDVAKRILAGKTLAAFGRHCTLRAYQDRPPITQCKNCWGWNHTSDRCKVETKCRLCGEAHTEATHEEQECATCQRRDEDDMETGPERGACDHLLKCANCVVGGHRESNHTADSRRCPQRLSKYGTARTYERKAANTTNPWKVVIPKEHPKPSTLKTKAKGKAKAGETQPTAKQASNTFTNAFGPIDPDGPNGGPSDWEGPPSVLLDNLMLPPAATTPPTPFPC